MTELGVCCIDLVESALDDYNLPKSEAAVRLLAMIAAHESGGFKYVKQLKGPAVSIFQIEPETLKDLVDYAKKRSLALPDCNPNQLIFNTKLSAAYARVFFMRFRDPLPDKDNIMGLARYAKRYWNTNLGKATVEDYYKAYVKYFN